MPYRNDDSIINGVIGMVLALAIPMLDVIEDSIQIIAGILGVFLIALSIRNKFLDYRIKKLTEKELLNKKDNHG